MVNYFKVLESGNMLLYHFQLIIYHSKVLFSLLTSNMSDTKLHESSHESKHIVKKNPSTFRECMFNKSLLTKSLKSMLTVF